MKGQKVLSNKEYREILAVNFLRKKGYNVDLEYLEQYFEDCKYWVTDERLVGINHFLAVAIEIFEEDNAEIQEILDWVYDLRSSHNFEVGEGGLKFTDNFLDQCIISPHNDLESKLISTQYLLK